MTGRSTVPVTPEVQACARRFHIFDQDIDVHEVTKGFRAQCPVARSDQVGGYWIASGYQAVAQVLRDPSTFSSARGNSVPPVWDPIGTWIPLHFDPPEHGMYRRSLNSYFLPKRMATREAQFREAAIGYLEPIVAKGGGELVSELTVPCPSMTFLAMLGRPPRTSTASGDWSRVPSRSR